MPSYTDAKAPTTEELLAALYEAVTEIKAVVLDLQQRQQTMAARQQAIREDFDQSGASEPKGSFATGYQKEKE